MATPPPLLLARRWSAVMAVQFAIGVVTGTVPSFEFGLLWPGMMGRWGDVFGIGFGVEAWAFFLEAVLIAIYLYGWRRLASRAHFLLGLPLPLVALLGAFGILAANSWMNTSRGFTLDAAGNPVDVKIWKAVFTGFLRGCPGLQTGEESDSCGAGQGQPDRRQGDPASTPHGGDAAHHDQELPTVSPLK
ncbi:cytochrome ubiquinol oxidase subunit I [Streptomyces sp. NPDC050743]|uniref:cytochrome ubiquinol oxidase subunit I n=1 Tax=Streptomyces sp. NPDC050743 TaxID=3365634 RepID=UPI0037B02740